MNVYFHKQQKGTDICIDSFFYMRTVLPEKGQ